MSHHKFNSDKIDWYILLCRIRIRPVDRPDPDPVKNRTGSATLVARPCYTHGYLSLSRQEKNITLLGPFLSRIAVNLNKGKLHNKQRNQLMYCPDSIVYRKYTDKKNEKKGEI